MLNQPHEVPIRIIDLDPTDRDLMQKTALLVHEGFRHLGEYGWPTLVDAREEVEECTTVDRISRVALDQEDHVVGWVAGRPKRDGNVWELHPLIIHEQVRRRGIGSRLVADLEAQVSARGGITVILGSDDTDRSTSLGGVNLYPNVLERAATIQNLSEHPFEFYQKQGYVIVGVLPDANGFGRPDIFMAKRVRRT